MRIKRKIGIVLGVFIAAVLVFWGVIFGTVRYNRWRAEEGVRKTAEALERFAKEDFDRAMADTVGGKTPQETLDLFIAAVESGDYELASKYFIGDKQEAEFEDLEKSDRKNIKNALFLLQKIKEGDGIYSFDEQEYSVDEPIYIRFKVYPNGIWKIIEI